MTESNRAKRLAFAAVALLQLAVMSSAGAQVVPSDPSKTFSRVPAPAPSSTPMLGQTVPGTVIPGEALPPSTIPSAPIGGTVPAEHPSPAPATAVEREAATARGEATRMDSPLRTPLPR